jgi:hypothetical protein
MVPSLVVVEPSLSEWCKPADAVGAGGGNVHFGDVIAQVLESDKMSQWLMLFEFAS